MRRLLPKLFCVLLLGPAITRGETDWTAVHRMLVDSHVIPRYQTLANTADALSASTTAFCTKPDMQGLERARADFHRVMDAWQGIEHLSVGPVEHFMRRYRIKYWPDKHGTGAKQLRAMLATENRDLLGQSALAEASVAVQGLPALERVLFSSKGGLETFGDQGAPGYRCELAAAIARNLAGMAQAILDEWTGGAPSYREHFLTAGDGNQLFDSNTEVASLLLTDLSTALQTIEEYKLQRPLGKDVARSKPRRAESWRSRRSLRNLRINLEALRDLYRTGYSPSLSADPQGAKLDERIETAFTDSIAAATKDEPLFDMVADPTLRPELERLLLLVRSLTRIASVELPAALDLTLGFNALDGD